jgi:hypothetical protein
MAAVNRDGLEPVAYLYGLADDPDVSVDKNSLDYLATQYGQLQEYVDYYGKAGTEIVPEIVDTKLVDQGVDFATASPEQIAHAVGTLVTEASTPATEQPQHTEQTGQQPQHTEQQTPEVPDEQILEELAAALGADIAEELQSGADQAFTQLTLALWKEMLPELQADLKEAAQTHHWASAEEAKVAAQEAVWAALTAAVDGYWETNGAAGGTLALYLGAAK